MAGQSAAISLAVQPAFSNTTALLSPVTASVAATSLGTTRRLRLRLSFFVGPFDHCDLLTSARTSLRRLCLPSSLRSTTLSLFSPLPLPLPLQRSATSLHQLFSSSTLAAVPAYFLTTALTTQPDSPPSIRYHSRTSIRQDLQGDILCLLDTSTHFTTEGNNILYL